MRGMLGRGLELALGRSSPQRVEPGQEGVVLGLLLLLAAIASPVLVAAANRIGQRLRSVPRIRLIALLSVIAFALALAVQQLLLDGIPHVTDETSYQFQAQIFAAGKITAPLPACYDLFWQHNVIMSGSGT